MNFNFIFLLLLQDEGDHTTIVAEPSQLIAAPLIVGEGKQHAPILFRGAALVTDKSNRLRLELLTASTTAYSFNPQSKIEEVLLSLLTYFVDFFPAEFGLGELINLLVYMPHACLGKGFIF